MIAIKYILLVKKFVKNSDFFMLIHIVVIS